MGSPGETKQNNYFIEDLGITTLLRRCCQVVQVPHNIYPEVNPCVCPNGATITKLEEGSCSFGRSFVRTLVVTGIVLVTRSVCMLGSKVPGKPGVNKTQRCPGTLYILAVPSETRPMTRSAQANIDILEANKSANKEEIRRLRAENKDVRMKLSQLVKGATSGDEVT